MGTRLGGRRTGGANGSSSVGCDACATRVPSGAVCASAPAASRHRTPAKATDLAALSMLRILKSAQTSGQPYGLRLERQRQLEGGSISGGSELRTGRRPPFEIFFKIGSQAFASCFTE